MDDKPKIISAAELSSINADVKARMGVSINEIKERSYLKACHQTAARIFGSIQELKTRDEIINFIGYLEDTLENFRNSEESHPDVLNEAINRAKKS